MLTPSAINFFRTQHRVAESQDLLDTRVLQIGGGVLVVGLLLVAITTGWWQWTLAQERQLTEQKHQQERVIAQSADQERQYLSFVTRLDTLQKLLQERNSKKEALDFLALLAKPDLGFDNIVYDSKNKQLAFRVQAASVFSVEEFLAELRDPDVSVYYQDVQVSNIRRDDTGQYIMDLAATLKGGLPSGQ